MCLPRVSTMNVRFDGKRALVTGAGKGLGRAIAKALYSRGAHVIALSRTASDLDSLRAEVFGLETQVAAPGMETHVADVSEWDDTRQLVQRLGDIDLLVNNAGVASLAPAADATEEEFDRLFNTNVKAALNMSQVVAKNLMSRGCAGSIVHVSSVAASRGLDQHVLYCGTKAALDGMMRVMALEWGKHQIRVNCVNPTVVLTEMGRMAWDNAQGAALKQTIPQGKFAEESDVVNAVLFLLSTSSDMINGTSLPIDGGQLVS